MNKKILNIILILLAESHILSAISQNRSSSYPFISGDTFRAIADHIVDETKQPFVPSHVKPGDIIFLKSDIKYIPYFFEKLHPSIKAPYILLTHNGDASPIFLASIDCPRKTYNFSSHLDDPRIIVWFAQNADLKNPKLRPLPLGIANQYWEHGNTNTIKNASTKSIPWEKKLNRIYVNFTINTNKSERQTALEACKKRSSYCDIKKKKNYTAYLDEMKQYRYVISPPGNGIDCHRTWEALLMGCIPLIKHSLLDSLFFDLPVIFIDSWNHITEDFLDKEYKKIQKNSYTIEKLFADYWIKEIKKYQKNFRH